MEELAAEFAPLGYHFVFVYVREAHPGEHFPHHDTFERKLAHARAFRDHFQARRTMLVDALDGALHRSYGTLPNMTYIVSRAGLVTFKSDWTDPGTIRNALAYQVENARMRREGMRLAPFYFEMQGLRWNDPVQFREGLERAGPKAVAEFEAAALAWDRAGKRPSAT